MRHLYVHVPFCKRRCSYCDFAIAVRKNVPGAQFAEAVAAELEFRREALSNERLETLYFGGGTPSLLSPDLLDRLIRSFGAQLGFVEAGSEITIEANPDDVSAEAVDRWLSAGVNRVSLGIQSLNPAVLDWMHRPHVAVDGLTAIRLLRSAGMPSISVDVIFGLPQALGADPVADLERLLELGPDHVSAYGLTVEPRTPLSRWISRGTVRETDESSYAEEFIQLHDLLVSHDFEHYEISNYAKPGRHSRHNRAYWEGRAYLGLGPSAHSFAGGVRSWNIREWAEYHRTMVAGRDPTLGTERLTDEQIRLERFYLGLRTADGADLTENRADSAPIIGSAVERGWLTITGNRVRATLEGWLRLDALVAGLTTSVEGG